LLGETTKSEAAIARIANVGRPKKLPIKTGAISSNKRERESAMSDGRENCHRKLWQFLQTKINANQRQLLGGKLKETSGSSPAEMQESSQDKHEHEWTEIAAKC
jgi:hypothetical protein